MESKLNLDKPKTKKPRKYGTDFFRITDDKVHLDAFCQS